MLSALCLKCVIVMGLGPLPLTLVLIVPLIVLLVVLWTTSSSFFYGWLIFMNFINSESVKTHICPFCGREIDTSAFKDELSIKEFQISGLCQNCQDYFFD